MPRPLAATLLVVALAVPSACAHQPRVRPEVRGEPTGEPKAERVGQLRLVGAWSLQATIPDFGGISAAALEGDRLWLLSDRSRLFSLDWPELVPVGPFGATMLSQEELRLGDGQELDAEALVLLPDGSRIVADEARGWLVRFLAGDARPAERPWPVAGLGDDQGTNQGLETVARLPDGSLLAIGEAEDGGPDRHRAMRLADDYSSTLAQLYRSRPGFRPTDAAVAGAHLFVLERSVSLLGGWRARIVAVPLSDVPGHPDGVIEGRELATLSGPTLGENHEALVAVAAGAGYELLVLADDNFSPLQRTLLVALTWSPEREDARLGR